ncbi:MAG: DUF4492 domain-containing protein [Bacteroidales bacterium]
MQGYLKTVVQFYIDGFKEMTIGKVLWSIILIKLAIMFLVLKPIFFTRTIDKNATTPQEKASFVSGELLKIKENR